MDDSALWFILLILQKQLFDSNQGLWTTGQVAIREQGRVADDFRQVELSLPLCYHNKNSQDEVVLCTHVHSCFSHGLWHLFCCSINLCVTSSSADTFMPSAKAYDHGALICSKATCILNNCSAQWKGWLQSCAITCCFPLLFLFSCSNMGSKMHILPA